jgi:branched-chain amino acid transport system substrate-binding protein
LQKNLQQNNWEENQMKTSKFVKSLLAGAAAFAVSATISTSAWAEDIIIGAAVAESGWMNAFDGPSLSGFKVFMEQLNAKGGVDGKKFVLKIADTKTEQAGSKDAATQLINDGAQILLTSANFDFGSPGGNVAQAKGMLNFSLGAASPLYGPQGIGPQAYSSAPSTYLEGNAITQTLADLGKKKPFVLIDDTIDYSTQVGQGVKDRAAKLGIKLAGEATFKNGDTSIATQISQIESSGADSIAIATFLPGGAAALRQIRAAGINLPVATCLGMGGTDWVTGVPNMGEFYETAVSSIYGDDPDKAVRSFVEDFTKATGAAPATSQAIEGYNVGELIVAALKETKGSTAGVALSKALDGFKKFKMLGGEITYSETQHIKMDGPVTVLKYVDGKPSLHAVVNITN